MKKNLLLILCIIGMLICMFFIATSCDRKECPVVPTEDYIGVVTGLSIDEHGRQFFEMKNQYGNPYNGRYSATTLAIGDSIKYTTPSDTCNHSSRTDLGRIVKYN